MTRVYILYPIHMYSFFFFKKGKGKSNKDSGHENAITKSLILTFNSPCSPIPSHPIPIHTYFR